MEDIKLYKDYDAHLKLVASIPINKKKVEEQVWARRRKPQTSIDQKLSVLGEQWLASLPEDLMLVHLPVRYPRIINQIAINWPLLYNSNKYLDALTIRQREDRQGFPEEVLSELIKISIYCRSREK